jgi:hypothetical protein
LQRLFSILKMSDEKIFGERLLVVNNLNVEVILLGVQPYSFKDKDSDRLVEGVNVYFIERQAEKSDYGVGFVPKKANLPIQSFAFLKDLEYPYSARVITESRFTSRGVMTKIVDFKPDKKVNIAIG